MSGPKDEGAADTYHYYNSRVMQQCCPLSQDSYCKAGSYRRGDQDIEVVETEMLSVLEHWLRKIEEEASKIFKQKLEKKVENKAETKTETKASPSAGQDLGMTKSQSVQVSGTKLPASSSSHGLLEERTRIQFIRWSHTQVYRVSSDMRSEAMRERLEKVRNSVSQVMLQAMKNNVSDTDIRATLSS